MYVPPDKRPAAKRPATDALGRQVPGRLEEVFAGRERLAQWCCKLDELRSELAGIGQELFGDAIDIPALTRQLARIRLKVFQGSPYGECECGAFTDCPHCKNKRWLTATEFLKGPKPVFEFKPLGLFRSNGKPTYHLSTKRMSAASSSSTQTWTSR